MIFLATVTVEIDGVPPSRAVEALMAHAAVATVRIAARPALSVVRVDVDEDDAETAGDQAGRVIASVIDGLHGTVVVQSHSAILESDR